MKVITIYESFDGKKFETSEQCRSYENQNVEARVLGMTIESLRAAIGGEDADLRDALEEIGRRCAVARREAGEFRRAPRRARGAEVEQPAAPVEQLGPPDSELDPGYRGDRDFKAGLPGMVPDDLKGDPVKREQWLAAWDAASLASAQARDARSAA